MSWRTQDYFGKIPIVGTVGPQGQDQIDADDLDSLAEYYLMERYVSAWGRVEAGSSWKNLLRSAYYALRPLMGVHVRRILQRHALRGWEKIPFPRWPLDTTVDDLFRQLIHQAIEERDGTHIPFIWFWPEGYSACAILTHDVETREGRDFSADLMDLDEASGFKSSFQFVPEQRYEITAEFLAAIRGRGFEINLHGLNHDGHLFSSKEEFTRRAARINAIAREWGAEGFRSPVLYRNAEWMPALNVNYDMSFPNVGHLDPQGGGCCTIMPWFNDHLVELPLTTTQDYPLFHILGDYSIDLWRRQIRMIIDGNGLATILVHPDYIIGRRERVVYEDLLNHLRAVCEEQNVWAPLPRDVAQWWRQRRQMKLVEDKQGVRVEGPGSCDARVGCARLVEGSVTYSLWDGGNRR